MSLHPVKIAILITKRIMFHVSKSNFTFRQDTSPLWNTVFIPHILYLYISNNLV